MINYIIKTEIEGVEIRLMYSKSSDKFYVLYGLEFKSFPSIETARTCYDNCVRHALELGGHYDQQ